MNYPIAETLHHIRESRGERTAKSADYMYRVATTRHGTTGDRLLMVQFFHYLLEDLPDALPKAVVAALTRMRCSNLMRAHSAPNYRDENHRRYWSHLSLNCYSQADCEYVISLSIEAMTALYRPSKLRGANLSFVTSQLLYLSALSFSALTVDAYAMLARLSSRMELSLGDIDGRAQQFYDFCHERIHTIDHKRVKHPAMPLNKRVHNIIPVSWLPTPTDTGVSE